MADIKNGNGASTRAWVIAFTSSLLVAISLTFTVTRAVDAQAAQTTADRVAKLETQGSDAFRLFQTRLEEQLKAMNLKLDDTNGLIKQHLGIPKGGGG